MNLTSFLLAYNNGTTVGDIAGEIGGSSAAGAIEDFNGFLLSMLIYAGAVIVAIAFIKLVIAIQQQDSHSKMQATLMFGLGAVFIASNAIISTIDIKGNQNDPEQIVINIVGVAGTVLKLVGIILLAYSLFQMILSFINEDGAQKADAGKMLAVGGTLFGIRSVLMEITDYALRDRGMAEVTRLIISVIADVARFVGIILAVYGLFNVLLALKEHDSSSLQRNIVLLTVGIVLTAMPFIFSIIGLPI